MVVTKKDIVGFFEFRGRGEVEEALAIESGKGNSVVENHVGKVVIHVEREGQLRSFSSCERDQ